MTSMSMVEPIVEIALSTLVGIIATVLSMYSRKRDELRTEEKTSKRLELLSSLLKEASSEIEKMDRDIEVRSKRLQEKEDKLRELESLLSLKDDQVNATKEEPSDTLKDSNRNNRIWTILIGAIWFSLGLVVRGLVGF